MLIPKETVGSVLRSKGISIGGVLHIGAHECEELDVYRYIGISDSSVVWIDALNDKVVQARLRGIPNVHQAVISDKDGEIITFYRTNNNQSSSILEFGTHANHYPWCVVTGTTQHSTKTIDTFLEENSIDASSLHFWNFDIQGAELKALKGGESALKYAKALYLEVNTEEVYKGCAKIGELDAYLKDKGFERVLTKTVKEGWGDALYLRV
jgi:FkbM family methyltransferase